MFHDLILDEITIRNFLSVGAVAQTVKLSSVPLTLILGKNLDNDDEESRNGAGKTAIIQAICYAFFGKPLTSIKLANLINDVNGKELQVILKFRSKGVQYRIERGQKPNHLRFFVNDKPVSTDADAQEVDEAAGENRQTRVSIERIIGMSRVMFEHIVALNTYTIPFLKMKPSEQRPVIEELFGITALSELASALKETMDEHKLALRDEEVRVKTVSDANDRIHRLIEAAEGEAMAWTVKQARIIEELRQEQADQEKVDFDAEMAVFDAIEGWHDLVKQRERDVAQTEHEISMIDRQLSGMREDQQRLLREIEQPATENAFRQQSSHLRLLAEQQNADAMVRACDAQAARLTQNAEEHERKGIRLEKELNDLIDQLENPDAHQCSTCGQGLAGTDHLTKVIARLAAQCERLAADIDQTAADRFRCEREAEEQEQAAALAESTSREQKEHYLQRAKALDVQADDFAQQQADRRLELATRVQQYDVEMASFEADRVKHVSRLQALPALPEKPRSGWSSRESLRQTMHRFEHLVHRLHSEQAKSNPLDVKLLALRGAVAEIDYARSRELDTQIKHEQFLYKLLTSKDSFIRKRIIDQNLGWLNRTLNAYIVELGMRHEVRFLPDLDVEISLDGRNRDFEQFSRGEMNRVALATSWGFRDMWEDLNGSINLLCCDEVLDQGTDGAGVEAAVAILSAMATARRKNVFLISHREELKNRIDRVLIAQKLDSFTTFQDA